MAKFSPLHFLPARREDKSGANFMNSKKLYIVIGFSGILLMLTGIAVYQVRFKEAPITFVGNTSTTPPPTENKIQPIAVSSDTIKSGNLSQINVERKTVPINVFLFAEDQKVETLKSPYCGGDEGAKQYSGNYHLISIKNNTIISDINLDKDYYFIEKRPHDGLREFYDPKTGEELIGIYQYGSCNTESVEFYRIDVDGVIHRVVFVNKNGSEQKEISTGPGGDVPLSREDEYIFCSYNNFVGHMFCDSYVYTGSSFKQTTSWMTQELGTTKLQPKISDEARRALFDYLSALSGKRYQEAVFYFGGSYESLIKLNPNISPNDKAKLFEAYCTSNGTKCFMPEVVADKDISNPAEMIFSVSFVTRDFDDVILNGQRNFDFRVQRIVDGFKVLNLPPYVP